MSEYTEEQWFEEMKAPSIVFHFSGGPFAFGTTLRCPDCKTIGFYGARLERRENDVDRKYRVCKFRGFAEELTGYAYEDSGGKPYRLIMLHCTTCGTYNWKVPWGAFPNCCGRVMHEVKWPTEDPSHPFHEFKKQIVQC
jgi:hypothetical protein